MKSGPRQFQPRSSLGRVFAITVGLIVCTQLAPAQQNSNLQLGVRSEGKPLAGAQIALLSENGRVNFPPTDVNGNVAAALNPAGIVDEYVEVWVEQCGTQSPQLYFLGPGGILPEPARCPRHRAGFFILRGEGPWQVTTDVALLTVNTAGSNPLLPETMQGQQVSSEHRIWFQGSGGAGFNLFPGATDNCLAIARLEPGAKCTVEKSTAAVLANGSVNWSMLGAEGGFWRASPSQLTSSATLGGVPSSLVSTFEARGFYVAGALRLPAFAHLQFSPKAGVTFWHADLNQKESAASGAPTVSASTVTGTSPFLGGAVDVMASSHIGIGADYVYLRLRNEPVVSQDHHLVTFHLTVRFGAK